VFEIGRAFPDRRTQPRVLLYNARRLGENIGSRSSPIGEVFANAINVG
jgi:hypothetical protein